MKQRVKLHIKGIVQGVGFRPHVFRLSRKFNLGGYVLNDSRGVTVELEGEGSKIKDFIDELKATAPAISRISTIKKKLIPPSGEKEFHIKASRAKKNKSASFPADIAICKDCLNELFDKNNYRYLYPFINCTNCGPRFTIIKDMPYDREKTTMKHFNMCPDCRKEYGNSANRRFHAEPNACFSCGPQIIFLNSLKKIKKTVSSYAATQITLKKTAKLITEGKIVAIKGIGGYHLGCSAKNVCAVRRLRQLKGRPTKPFAVMVSNLRAISEICNISDREKELIESRSRPIVLLKINGKASWAKDVCPGQNYLGVMLCCAPLHYLLFSYLEKFEKSPILIMTSANKGDFPLVSCEEELINIEKYADYFLTHNRPIHIKCDDSIARVFQNKEIIVRKARGYTPDFMDFTHKKEILACGAELKNTFSLANGGHLISSPYLGDLKNYENYELFLKTLSHYKKILGSKPQVIAHDLHPGYLSTQYALSSKQEQKIAVQHHHAHLAGCLFENNVNRPAIGICFDGAGLGSDNAIWGGEFFLTGTKSFERAGHFKYFGLLGVDKSAEEPRRMAFSLLYDMFGENMFKHKLNCFDSFNEKEKHVFYGLMQNKEFILSSSAGRLFDAGASILDIRQKVGYEAEGAILLEMLAASFGKRPESYDYNVKKENKVYIIDWQPMFSGLVKDVVAKKDKKLIAYKFHFTFAKIISEVCTILRKECGINDVALSGGVFQNFLLLDLTVKKLKANNFSVHYHKRIPTNDSGISVGQAVVANAYVSA